MANNSSGKFFIGSIVIFFIIAGVVAVVLNNMKALADNALPPESMEEQAIAERLQPVAQVHVGEAPVAEEAPADDMQVNRGQQIVESVCAVCHATGMMDSPRTNKASDWAPRLEQGIETVYANAINGINMMPARGGRPDLSDDEVKAAVDYMISDLK
ncbi:cytochrome c family protein [Methylophaga lonarensis MPL]|uniref:Cytochrome c family protein n=1 Tax=Methylophaga lonarensis MPL TaxID=1286106 RepID=M7PQT3_9GAMM|nr:c-type cytochrome [Methylophaga lonarensis]EMR12774.1 cytochrome c family protein [Methylophaga lonarensis MPL]